MKKTHYLKWLCLIVCAVWIAQGNAQGTPCLNEDFSSMTVGSSSNDCPSNGATNVTHLRSWTGSNSSRCPGDYTLSLPTGNWAATSLGALVSGQHSGTFSIAIARGVGRLSTPELTSPQIVTFYAKAEGSVGTNDTRGFKIWVNNVELTAASGTVWINDSQITSASTSVPSITGSNTVKVSDNSWSKIELRLNLDVNATITIGSTDTNGASGVYVDAFTATCLIGPSIEFSSDSEGAKDQEIMETEGIDPITFDLKGSATNTGTIIFWDEEPTWITVDKNTEGQIIISSNANAPREDRDRTYTYTITPGDGTDTGDPISGTITVTALGT